MLERTAVDDVESSIIVEHAGIDREINNIIKIVLRTLRASKRPSSLLPQRQLLNEMPMSAERRQRTTSLRESGSQ
jgi:hypothetical protein